MLGGIVFGGEVEAKGVDNIRRPISHIVLGGRSIVARRQRGLGCGDRVTQSIVGGGGGVAIGIGGALQIPRIVINPGGHSIGLAGYGGQCGGQDLAALVPSVGGRSALCVSGGEHVTTGVVRKMLRGVIGGGD